MDRLISEQAVIDTIKEWTSYMFTTPTGDLLKQIKAIPSADIDTLIDGADAVGYRRGYKEAQLAIPSAEPKTGHWITTRTFMHDGEYYCDRCKCESPNNEKWDYCPNCGCRMSEPQESEVEE